MPDSSGFADAPVTRALLFYLMAASIVVSIADVKDLVDLRIGGNNLATIVGEKSTRWFWWVLGSVWRFGIWQLACTNSTEVLFATLTLYRLRVVERLWGSRKFASFILLVLPLTSFLTPLFLILFTYPLSFLPFPSIFASFLSASSSHHSSASTSQQFDSQNTYYYIPAGPTPILFALLAQFSVIVPAQYRWRVGLGLESILKLDDTSADNQYSGFHSTDKQMMLTSKSLSYVPALQLAFCALPGSFVGAVTGWVVGTAYMEEMLPRGMAGWRVGTGWRIGR